MIEEHLIEDVGILFTIFRDSEGNPVMWHCKSCGFEINDPAVFFSHWGHIHDKRMSQS